MNKTYPSPLDSLTDQQKQKIAELKQIVAGWIPELEQPERDFLDELCYYRYAMGYLWKVDEAAKYLRKTLDWRKSFKPYKITLEDVKKVASHPWLFHHGYTKQGHPIVYVHMGKDKFDNDEETRLLKFKYIVYVSEQCVKKMPKNVFQCVWVLDLHDCSVGLDLFKKGKDMFLSLGDYYCERMKMTVTLNMSWTLSFLWHFIKVFLYPETLEKYQFVSGDKEEIKKHLLKYIEEDQLISHYSGTADYTYNLTKMLEQEYHLFKSALLDAQQQQVESVDLD